jgi:hypothetical protein
MNSAVMARVAPSDSRKLLKPSIEVLVTPFLPARSWGKIAK